MQVLIRALAVGKVFSIATFASFELDTLNPF